MPLLAGIDAGFLGNRAVARVRERIGFHMKVVWTLPRSPLAASLARRHVRDACRGCPDEAREIAVLLASEIVTNAVRHGGGPVAMWLARSADHLRVEVEDEDPHEPTVTSVDLLAEGGRGLRLVGALAADWGVSPTQPAGSGKRVWFEVKTTPVPGEQELA